MLHARLFSQAGQPEGPPALAASQLLERRGGGDVFPGAVRTAAKPRLCLLDTHWFPPSNLPWHREDNSLVRPHPGPPHKSSRLVHVVTAPQVSGLSSLSFPLMLSARREILACPPFPGATLPQRRASRAEGWGAGGRERCGEARPGRHVTLGPGAGGFHSSLAWKHTGLPPSNVVRPRGPALPGSVGKAGLEGPWPWPWGGGAC